MLRPGHIASTIAIEEAAIDRRFSNGRFGHLFHGDDGRAWKVREDQAHAFKDRANDHMLAFVARSANAEIGTILGGLAFAALTGFVWDMIFGSGRGAIGSAFLAFFCVHPLLPFIRLWMFRRAQRSMREEFVRSLGLVSPLPIEVAKQYRLVNVWYPLMYAVIFLMIASVVFIEKYTHHALNGTFSASGRTITNDAPIQDIGILLLIMLPGLALAWIFYFLGKATDKKLSG